MASQGLVFCIFWAYPRIDLPADACQQIKVQIGVLTVKSSAFFRNLF